MKKFTLRSPVTVATILSLLVLAVALAVLARGIRNQSSAFQWLVHTREVLENVQSIIAHTSEAEAAQRGFLLTGSPGFVTSYRQARDAVLPQVAELRMLTSDNPRQQALLRTFEDAVRMRLELLERVLRERQEGRAPSLATLESGLRLKGRILAQVELIRAEEQRLLRERQERVETGRRELIAAFATTGVMAVLLVILLWVLSSRDAARLRARAQALAESERKLIEANQLLEQRVEQRTAQIAEANAELRAFAHTVAHDLRAPLRNVEGFATALLEDEGERMSVDGRLFAERIVAAVVRMDRLITDLLAYSRLSRAELRLERVELGTVVKAVLRDLEAQVADSGARVDVAWPLPAVRGNGTILAQVVANLVSNAIKFVERGVTPQVAITGTRDGMAARLLIADNGIGIAPEHREHVFGVFERLHGHERYPGTGIGLAIVKKGLERMGGTVRILDREGGGTLFELSMPAAD